jgi:hypothetical protein
MYIYNIHTYKITYIHIYIYIHTHTHIYIYPLRVRGFAGTGITFSYPREKTHRVENQTRGYKLTHKPAPYRVFTRGHAGKMCPLPSLPVSQRSNDYFAPTVDCNTLNARQRAQRSRARVDGTPDSLQDLSGAPPDSQAGPHVRAPTVGTQRPGDVAGAPDCPVRHATAASTKRLVWWLGL